MSNSRPTDYKAATAANATTSSTTTTSTAASTSTTTLTTKTITQPRSILKKPSPTSPLVTTATNPISFYSGNEATLPIKKLTINGEITTSGDNSASGGGGGGNGDFDVDDVNSFMYNMEKRITMHPHKAAANAARDKLHELELHHRINGDDEEEEVEIMDESISSSSSAASSILGAQEDENRRRQQHPRSLTTGTNLKKSALTAPWHGPGHNHIVRKPSTAYILHSKQIDAEVYMSL